jgi:hypothetical protein
MNYSNKATNEYAPVFHITFSWLPWRCLSPISVFMDLAYRCSFSSSCLFALFLCYFFGRLESCLILLYLLPVASGTGWLSLLVFPLYILHEAGTILCRFHVLMAKTQVVPVPTIFYFPNLHPAVSFSRRTQYDSWLFHTTALSHITFRLYLSLP